MDRETGKLRKPYSDYPNHAWYVLGDIAYKKNEIEAAKSFFRRSFDYDRHDVSALMALANCYSMSSQYKYAKRTLELAHRLEPQSSRITYNLANVMFDLKEYRSALRLYRLSLRGKDKEVSRLAAKNIDVTIGKTKSPARKVIKRPPR